MKWRRMLHRLCVVLGGAWAVTVLLYPRVIRNPASLPSEIIVGTLPLGLYLAVFWIFSGLYEREWSVQSAHHQRSGDSTARIAAAVSLAILALGVVALYRLPEMHRYKLFPLFGAGKYGPVALMLDSNTGHACSVELNEHGQQAISTYCWPLGSGPPEP